MTTKTDPNTAVAACYLACFGMEKFRSVVNTHGAENAHDIFEREIYYSGLNIPGHDFSRASRFGPRKEPFGLRRTEVNLQQEKIATCLSKLK